MMIENPTGTVTVDFDDDLTTGHLDIWVEAGGRYENIEMSVGEVRKLIALLNQALEDLT